MISVEVLQGRSALESLASEWDELLGSSYTAAFCQSAWHLAWLDANPPGKIAAVLAREDGRLIGMLPLAQDRSDSRGLYFRRLTPIAYGDYQAPVIAPDRASEVLPLMLDAAVRHFGRRGVFWWPNIPKNDPSLEPLRLWLASRNMPYIEETEQAPRLRLNGRSYESVERDWASSHRRDVNRQRKRLANEKGPVSLWVPATVEEAEPVLTEFFKVHDGKWLSQGFPGMFNERKQKHFRAVLHRLFGHTLHFSTVRCGGIDVSYLIGFCAGGWLQYYRPSYRPEFGVYSPSKIHIGMLVEEACRQNLVGIDFLLGGYSYKYSWANETNEVTSIHAGFHKLAPAYLWFSRGKPYVRDRLGEDYLRARAWLQKLRGKQETAGPGAEGS